MCSSETVNQLVNQATSHIQQEEYGSALDALRQALSLSPDNLAVLNLLGVTYIHSGDRDNKAQQAFERMLEIEPNSAKTYNNLGTLHWQNNNLEQAEKAFAQAIAIKPNMAIAYKNLANIHLTNKDITSAISTMFNCVKNKPESLTARNKLCWLLELDGQFEEAINVCNGVLAYQPDNAEFRYIRGLLFLKLGQYQAGWADYEWRFSVGKLKYPDLVKTDFKEWDGSNIAGKKLLVIEEQGFGDAIQMARYIPILQQKGIKLMLRCRPKLVKLFKQSFPGVEVKNSQYSIQSHRQQCDYHIPIMSLPHLLGTQFDSIPVQMPYLHFVDSVEVDNADLIDRDKFSIGLFWTGNPQRNNNDRRACTLSDFMPLQDIPDVTLYSLQIGPGQEQIKEVADNMDVVDLMSGVKNFLQTAALIKKLDLVITVDTSVAHLAGALDCPVWTILDLKHCWRYGLKSGYSPWYPKMKLFRQQSDGDWGAVIAEVKTALAKIKQSI